MGSAGGHAYNIWGTIKADVDDDYCCECERALPYHYDKCPKKAI